MLGQKQRDFKAHSLLILEALVPANHFYRKLEAKLDLEFVRNLVQERYATLGWRMVLAWRRGTGAVHGHIRDILRPA
jgi:hypothetical protein